MVVQRLSVWIVLASICLIAVVGCARTAVCYENGLRVLRAGPDWALLDGTVNERAIDSPYIAELVARGMLMRGESGGLFAASSTIRFAVDSTGRTLRLRLPLRLTDDNTRLPAEDILWPDWRQPHELVRVPGDHEVVFFAPDMVVVRTGSVLSLIVLKNAERRELPSDAAAVAGRLDSDRFILRSDAGQSLFVWDWRTGVRRSVEVPGATGIVCTPRGLIAVSGARGEPLATYLLADSGPLQVDQQMAVRDGEPLPMPFVVAEDLRGRHGQVVWKVDPAGEFVRLGSLSDAGFSGATALSASPDGSFLLIKWGGWPVKHSVVRVDRERFGAEVARFVNGDELDVRGSNTYWLDRRALGTRPF